MFANRSVHKQEGEDCSMPLVATSGATYKILSQIQNANVKLYNGNGDWFDFGNLTKAAGV